MRKISVILFLLFIGGSVLTAKKTLFLLQPAAYGNRIAFCYGGDIWVKNIRNGRLLHLTDNTAYESHPLFSPDGRWIIFASTRRGSYDLYKIPSVGGKATRLTWHPGKEIPVAFTPDGKEIICQSRRPNMIWFISSLYRISLKGGALRPLKIDRGYYGSFSKSGRFFAFNRKQPNMVRKGYRGSGASDIWITDLKKGTFVLKTSFKGQNAFPMWIGRNIYFVSNRDGILNLWKLPVKWGKPVQLTRFKKGGITYASLSADKKFIIFEQDFVLWKYTLASGRLKKLNIHIPTESKYSAVIRTSSRSRLFDFALHPFGKRIAFSFNGEIFTSQIKKDRKSSRGILIRRITKNSARDDAMCWSRDGKKLAFLSDRSGEVQVYVCDYLGKNLKKLTNSKGLKLNLKWAPDGKKLLYVNNRRHLIVLNIGDKKKKIIDRGKDYFPNKAFWSPDSRWIVYFKESINTKRTLYIANVKSGKRHTPLPNEYVADYAVFTPNGKGLLFTGSHDLYKYVFYIALKKSKYAADQALDDEKLFKKYLSKKKKKHNKKKKRRKRNNKKKKIQVRIDFKNIHQRIRKLTKKKRYTMYSDILVSPDSKKVAYIQTSWLKGTKTALMICSVKGTKHKRLAKMQFIWNIHGERSMAFSKKGKEIYYKYKGRLYRVKSRGGKSKLVPFMISFQTARLSYYRQLLVEAWRSLRDYFYDKNMHGVNWTAVRKNYERVLPYIKTKKEISLLINRMFGELKASHLGFYPARRRRRGGIRKKYFPGFEFRFDKNKKKFRFSRIYKNGPLDKTYMKIKKGDYLFSINGIRLQQGNDVFKIICDYQGDYIEMLVGTSSNIKKSRRVYLRPISYRKSYGLYYQWWVNRNRKIVSKLSGGKIAYIHIKAMNGKSLRLFDKELMENRGKLGVVIDVRFNGGGNIDQSLIDILERRPYQIHRWRDGRPDFRPSRGFYGSKVVIINEYSYSDAEVFPQAFKDRKLGKVVGAPTSGYVIGTSSYWLFDGSRIRTPSWGLWTLKGRNLEKVGVKPDYFVRNLPRDVLRGIDRQLVKAVRVAMQQAKKMKIKKPKLKY